MEQLSPWDNDEYKFIALRQDPQYAGLVRATEMVKQFIIKNKCIVYGGTAIDFALRLKGDKIYNDAELPISDLDFYSTDNVKMAYLVADELFAAGFTDTRAVRAKNFATMRVDLIDFHIVADIHYDPPIVFDCIPTLVFQGMRFVHPHFQRFDVHESLRLPYNDPPTENIFNRWKKDITRFNLLDKYYPMPKLIKPSNVKNHSINIIPGYVIQGFAAYSIIYYLFITIMSHANDGSITKGKHNAEFIASQLRLDKNAIVCDSPFATLDIVSLNLDKLAATLPKGAAIKRFEPFGSLVPDRLETGDLRAYSSKNQLLSVNEVTLFDANVRVCNIQTVLKWFLGNHYYLRAYKRNEADLYFNYYISLFNMIKPIEALYPTLSDADKLLAQVFFPSIITFGGDNVTISQEIILNQIKSQIYGDTMLSDMPINYYPARGHGHPAYDYSANPIYALSGKEIESK